MSNLCFVKTLKGEVNNDYLPFFNAVRIFVDTAKSALVAQGDRAFRIKAQDPNLVTIKNIGGMFCDSSGANQVSEKLLDGTEQNVWYTAATRMIVIFNASQIRVLNIYASSATLGVTSIPPEDLANITTAISMQVGGVNQKGEPADFAWCTGLLSLYINTAKISGDIAGLKTLTSLVTLNLSNTVELVGDFASLAPYRAAGTMSVTLPGNINANKLTCNGVNLATIWTGNSGTLTFDGNGNVSAS